MISSPNSIDTIMRSAPVIPVIVIHDLADAVPMAEALVAGGLPVLEVTLRTPVALDAITAMAKVEGAIIGAGTVCNPGQLDAALNAGSRFIVAPGLTEPLGRAALASGTPFLPGIANAGDIMRGMDLGLDRFKFFPAMAAGGPAALKALASVFGHLRFCPTGGISEHNAPEWLGMDVVLCVGGSWLVPSGPLNPAEITARARAAAALSQGS